MRLFVNVYWPVTTNTVYADGVLAKQWATKFRAECVGIEYDGTLAEAERELHDFTADGLRRHYPLPPPGFGGSAGTCGSAGTTADLGQAGTITLIGDAVGNHEARVARGGGDGLGPNGLYADAVTVGDLNSNARGSGARKSSGKPDWSQLPFWTLEYLQSAWSTRDGQEFTAGNAIAAMSLWQRGTDAGLEVAGAIVLGMLAKRDGTLLPREFPIRSLQHVVRVLEFGAKKYDKGNWARGMSWSVCFTSTMSHLTKAFAGEELDEESKLLHLAHALCNIIFLLGYRDLFPEGDDRLPVFKPGGVK